MKSIFSISKITFLELLRERLVFVSFIVAILLFLMSFLLGILTFDEQTRVMTHLGMAAIHLSLVVVAGFIGATFLKKEISRQTCLIVLARPVSRAQYLVGKFLGIFLLLTVIWLILSTCLAFLLESALPLDMVLISLFGLLLEAVIILAIALGVSSVFSPAVSIVCVFGVYLTGHWLEDLQFFAKKSENPMFILFAKIMNWVTPHLESMNWRSVSLIQTGISGETLAWALIHTFGWVGLSLSFAYFLFRRKDLV